MKRKSTNPGLILIGGNLVAVESPDEGGESWKDFSFSGIRVNLQDDAVKVIKFKGKIPLQDVFGKPASWVSRSSIHESRNFESGVWKCVVAFSK